VNMLRVLNIIKNIFFI